MVASHIGAQHVVGVACKRAGRAAAGASCTTVRGRAPKWLLREVLRPLLPESIRERRDKSPCPVPAAEWLTGPLSGCVRAIIQSPRYLDRGIFHPDRLREDGIAPALAWRIVNLGSWFRIFIDRDPDWVIPATSLAAPTAAHRG
jgi:hypothetical protein